MTRGGKKRDYAQKMAVLSPVERGGEVRRFNIANANTDTIKPIVDANLKKESMLMIDEAAY